jgi:ribose transport system permease protein
MKTDRVARENGEESTLTKHDVEERATPGWHKILHFASMREIGIFASALLIFTLLYIFEPTFRTQSNILNVVRQISLLGIVAVGMTYVFIAGELDLSVGSMYGFLSALMAYLTIKQGLLPIQAILITVAAGALFGFVNGSITTRFGIPSFIVTLAGLSVFRGAALLISEGFPISGLESPTLKSVASGYAFGTVPAQVFWLAAVMLVGGFVLAKTRFGYNVYATGGNPGSAANVGINTSFVKTTCFVITGALTGLAAVLLVGWLRGSSPLAGQGFELDVIAAVIIGGTNLFGGSGSVLGTFLGAAIIGMISNGLVLLGVSAFWEPVVKGLIILFAVLLDVTIRRRREA